MYYYSFYVFCVNVLIDFRSIWPSFSLILDLFNPSFLQNLRSDWIQICIMFWTRLQTIWWSTPHPQGWPSMMCLELTKTWWFYLTSRRLASISTRKSQPIYTDEWMEHWIRLMFCFFHCLWLLYIHQFEVHNILGIACNQKSFLDIS